MGIFSQQSAQWELYKFSEKKYKQTSMDRVPDDTCIISVPFPLPHSKFFFVSMKQIL